MTLPTDVDATESLLAAGDYVADRSNRPAGALTPAETVAELQRRQLPTSIVEEVTAILGAGEQLRYAGGGGDETSSIVERCRTCIGRLESARWR